MSQPPSRSRWAAIGAAIAVTVGFSGFVTGSLAAPNAGPGSTGSFHPIAPVRILDTRPAPENVGGIAGPVGQGGTITLKIGGVAPVPANATAVVLNVTVTVTTAPSFLTVWPADQARPTASNLNWTAGEVIPNLVTVQLPADGRVSFFNLAGTTHVIADVAGYYTPSNDKFISLPLTGMTLTGSSSISESFPGGIRMPDNSAPYPVIVMSLTLPPDYSPGTPVSVNLSWLVGGACNVAFQPNNLTVTRPGLSQVIGISTSSGWSVPLSVSAAAGIVNRTTGTIVSPNAAIPLQPGDSLLIGLFRRANVATDTCDGLTATITGISVSYP